MKKTTNQGIEFLRLVLMFMIVLEHILGHGAGVLSYINTYTHTNNPTLGQWLLYIPCVMAVDCFVFISGYFGINYERRKILRLAIQALSTTAFLLLGILILKICGFDYQDFGFRDLISMFLPIGFNYWWFLSLYIILLVLSPFFNKYLELSNKDRWSILFILFWINCIGGLLYDTAGANLGYSLLNFIFIYLLGRELHITPKYTNQNTSYSIYYLVSLILLYGSVYLLKDMEPFVLRRFFAYNNPLILLNAIFFFRMFLNMNIKYNVKTISIYSFGIYLLHDNPIVRPLLSNCYLGQWGIPMAISIFLFCLCVEAVRYNIIKWIQDNYSRIKT